MVVGIHQKKGAEGFHIRRTKNHLKSRSHDDKHSFFTKELTKWSMKIKLVRTT